MGEVLTCEADLEAVVGGRPAPMLLKSIRFLDDHCERFLDRSTFAVLGTTTSGGSLQAIALGGAPGSLAPRSGTTLELGRTPSGDVIDGAPAGLVALVPGYGEMLRINGRLEVQGGRVALRVDEALLHCAKATIRSELWSPPPTAAPIGGAAPPALGAFLAGSPFVVLVSTDAGGHADASPKGDPEGLVRRLDDATIAIADRPGNRRTDTLHNLMEDTRIALLALTPGSHHVAEVRGTARVSTDAELLGAMRLRNRTPKVAIVIDVDHAEVRLEPALSDADLWNPARHVAPGDLPPAATIWADHVRRNTDPGAGARVARRLVSKTALAAGVALDYRTNL